MASSGVFLVLIISIFVRAAISHHQHPSFNIVDFGAKPDGKTDSKQSLEYAWKMACDNNEPSVVVVPKGTFYTSPVKFEGKCSSGHITIVVHGVLVAPKDYKKVSKAGMWLSFHSIDGLTIKGTGNLDARGQSLWKCKSGNGHCPPGGRLLALQTVTNVRLTRLTFSNSQMFHISVNGCHDVNILGVKIRASETSDNTDGIHIEKSTGVNIIDADIQVGDDCISAGEGTHNLFIILCPPSSFDSIGSLGKYNNEQGVSNITARYVTFNGTKNGFRIKSWARRYKGLVQHVLFEHSIMNNVANPIIIDQHYCPDRPCSSTKKASHIKISDVKYQHIHGTSASEVAIRFDCSSVYPCTDLELQDVKLESPTAPLQSECVNANGKTIGTVIPQGCF